MENIVKVQHQGIELGSIVKSTYHSNGIGFFSNDNDGLQLGYMNRPDDYIIAPHTHNKIKREVFFTEEIKWHIIFVIQVFIICRIIYIKLLLMMLIIIIIMIILQVLIIIIILNYFLVINILLVQ